MIFGDDLSERFSISLHRVAIDSNFVVPHHGVQFRRSALRAVERLLQGRFRAS
ncbi:MAG: hypothetical protein ACI9DC_003241 [Gammaproteobacteria bacterium]|jgi:hypothetical protein